MKRTFALIGLLAAAGLAAVAVVRRTSSGATPGLGDIPAAVAEAYAGTVAALASYASEDEHAASDARARETAERLGRAIAALPAGLDPDLRARLDAFSEIVTAEQIRLMGFAINRKNRLPDGGQLSVESDDRTSFAAEAGPLFEALRGPLRIEA